MASMFRFFRWIRSSLIFLHLFFRRNRCCVTNRWTLGRLYRTLSPFFTSRVTTKSEGESSLPRPNSLRIFEARFGPNLLGISTSVSPGISWSPFFNTTSPNHGDIRTNFATPHGLSLTLTLSSGAIARLAFSQKETDSGVGKNTLFHGESLLVISAGDFEHVTSEGRLQSFSFDFAGNTKIVKGIQLGLVGNFEHLVCSIWRIRNIKLHDCFFVGSNRSWLIKNGSKWSRP